MNDHPATADLYAYDLTDAVWHRSPHSAGEGQCVEVTNLPGGIAVRDSKDTHLPEQRYSAAKWQAFRRSLLDGTL